MPTGQYPRKKQNLAERFWKKVKKLGPEECWPWMAGRDGQGYGSFHLDHDTSFLAHRVAYWLTTGEMPPPHVKLRHTCDHPWCCNAAHLVKGTQADNIKDIWARGRMQVLRGEAAGNAKLTEQDVLAIRRDYIPGVFGCNRLAKLYGVSKENITKILQRKSWAHL